ncbi:MAG: hypothetical protein ACTHW2_04290 [Tissierella sp.]|uniref:hypothetical protein n=1 Tax=Tissierella sp. TaxID=41274 RepID=UPI003F9B5ED0
MNKDNKNLLKYLGILFLTVLLTYKLPHDSYSIIEYIIPPIKTKGGGVFYLSGIVPLILFIIGVKGLFKLERFEDNSKLLLFFVTIIIVIPLMKWTIDVSRTNYHWIKDDGLKSIEIEESSISLTGSDDEIVMNVSLELKDYSRSRNEFKIRVYLPENLKEHTGKRFYDLENYYITHNGRRNTSTIEEDIAIKSINGEEEAERLFDSNWYLEDMKYELYNNEEKVEFIQHGM